MVSDASLEAYNNGRFGGSFSDRELQVLGYLKRSPWACRHEISEGTGIALTTVSGRCSDLKKKGAIVESERSLTKYSNVKIGLLALATQKENENV